MAPVRANLSACGSIGGIALVRLAFASFVTAGVWVGLAPANAACDITGFETGAVAAVLDGETLRLTDGRTVRLIGAKAPRPPLGWRGDQPWPFVEEAQAKLEPGLG